MNIFKFGEKLSTQIKRNGMTNIEVAKYLGVDKSMISHYLAERYTPSPSTLKKMCTLFNVDMDYWLGDMPTGNRIPVYGKIAAGIPIEAIEEIEGWEDVPNSWNIKEYFALQVCGLSMLPLMKSGDVVIFHKQETADDGDIVAVLIGNQDATCKQLMRTGDGITLHSYNELYKDMVFSPSEIEDRPVNIIGKAVELRVKL